jgi:hypothetical protein
MPTTYDDCVICYSGLRDNVGACIPCGHVFHASCFQRWAVSQPEKEDSSEEEMSDSSSPCPLCMQPVVDFQRIYLNITSPPRPHVNKPKKVKKCAAATAEESPEQDALAPVSSKEVVDKSQYEDLQREMENLRSQFQTMEVQYEQALQSQSRSNQELLEDCFRQHRSEVLILLQNCDEKEEEKLRWKIKAMDKATAVIRLEGSVRDRDERIRDQIKELRRVLSLRRVVS